MDAITQKRIYESDKIMSRIQSDGYDDHSGLIDEAVRYFLLDVLHDDDFERLKLDFKKDFK